MDVLTVTAPFLMYNLMSTHPKRINFETMSEEQRHTLAIYLVGSAAYENLFQNYTGNGIAYTPDNQFTGQLRDALLESYYSIFIDSPNYSVEDFKSTINLFENIRYFLKEYDFLLEELGEACGKEKLMDFVTKIRQAADVVLGSKC